MDYFIEDNRSRGKRCLFVLKVYIFVLVLELLQRFISHGYYSGIEKTGTTTFLSTYWFYSFSTLLMLAFICVMVTNTIVFIAWFRKSYSNLHAMGVDNLRFADTWAVAAWFLPVVNWIVGFKIMKELIINYNLLLARYGQESKISTSYGLYRLKFWAAFWIIRTACVYAMLIYGFVTNILQYLRTIRGEDIVSEEWPIALLWFQSCLSFIYIIAGIILYHVVKGMTKKEEALYRILLPDSNRKKEVSR